MSCHGNDEKKEKKGSHSSIKHMLLMVLCCGLPILLLAILPILNISNPSLKIGLASIIPFLCPIMMIFMIPMMLKGLKGSKSCDEDTKKEI